ncbi:Glycosidase [Sarracenia purpurea var. burkii]
MVLRKQELQLRRRRIRSRLRHRTNGGGCSQRRSAPHAIGGLRRLRRLRIHITDAGKQRWEAPYNLLPGGQPPQIKQSIGHSVMTSEYSDSEPTFGYTTDPFAFTVKWKSNDQTLFNPSFDESDPYSALAFKDQCLEISTKMPNDSSLYGLRENAQPHEIKVHPGDPYPYRSHPVYVDPRNVVDLAHVFLLLKSNGMNVFSQGLRGYTRRLGGAFDFYSFLGPTPVAVGDQYTALIGRPAPMLYGALVSRGLLTRGLECQHPTS